MSKKDCTKKGCNCAKIKQMKKARTVLNMHGESKTKQYII